MIRREPENTLRDGEKMEEILTRFEIVRLAVKLGDFRTIDIQSEKLRALSLDDKLNEIVDLLESRNYRQALYEMKHYASSLEDDFFDTPVDKPAPRKAADSSDSRPTPRKRSEEPAGLFDLEPAREEEEPEERVLDLEEILRLSEGATRTPEDYEPAPEFSVERSSPQERSEPVEAMEPEPPLSSVEPREEESEREPEASEGLAEPEYFGHPEAEEPVAEDAETQEEYGSGESEPAVRTSEFSELDDEERKESPRHPPISYISQKFRNMMHQFPPVEQEAPVPPEVEIMQRKISSEGYTEEEIEEFLRHYQAYKEAGRKGEAAMVLLLAAATESKFAQFMLARELFRGEIIQQDHAEAFTQINTLADQNFAEAICDLGQFYEHGIGIGKDRQMALLLYEEAAEMGVARARKHYERLKNSGGLLGVFKKVSLPKVSIPLPKKS